MKYLFIFVVILFACSDEPQKKCTPFEVIISDALPIQFWQADCDTYNEKEVCGVHAKCWCQPWECDDEIPLQFTDTSELDYILRALDENNEILFELPFESFQEEVGYPSNIFENYPLNTWVNDIDTGDSWITGGSLPSVTLTTALLAGSKVLISPISSPSGTFAVDFGFSNTGSDDVRLNIRFFKNGVDIGAEEFDIPAGTSVFGPLDFTLTDKADQVGVSCYKLVDTGDSEIAFLQAMTTDVEAVNATPVVYSTSFTPSETTPGICNEMIRLEIVNVTASPENVVAKSDCLDIRQSHSCTNVIEYFNNLNLDGLIYEDISPISTFRIRVPSIFFHEKFVEEDNVIKLTSSIVKTSSSLEAQRLFETDYAPYYWHRKLQLIFKHQNIAIDGQNWVKREAYEIQEGDRRWPLKKAKVYLNESDYSRAVL